MRLRVRPLQLLVTSLVAAVFATAPACSSTPEDTCSFPVSSEKELLINEPSVITDARAKNSEDGPWSFRFVMENMAPPNVDPGDFVLQWLRTFETQGTYNGYPLNLPNEDRSAELNRVVLCPWFRRSPANACNEDCSQCASKKLDLAQAPFRLEAIVNRLDLREQFEDQPSGEGRFVYGMKNGAADDPSSDVLAFGMTIEYSLPDTHTPKEWAEMWHALGSQPDFGEAYKAELEKVTRAFSARGSQPRAVNGSALAQVRTNESALNWIWQLREFKLDATGKLAIVPVRNTPATDLNNSAALADWLNKNRDAVLAKKHDLPASFRGGSADALLFTWSVPNVDEPLRRAFAGETCNGCHSGENISVDSAFHISPFRSGRAALSSFILNKSGGPDELTRREKSFRDVLCKP